MDRRTRLKWVEQQLAWNLRVNKHKKNLWRSKDYLSEGTKILMITDHHIRVFLHAPVLLLSFFSPFFYGSFSTLYRLSLIIWTLHLLVTWTPTWAPILSDTPFSSLWVAAVKVVLFRDLLHINVAKKATVVYLMWWWQLFLRYFEFSSFSRVQGVFFNSLNIHLLRIFSVHGEVTPRTFFLCLLW